jgi:hypothetical protein
MDAHANQSFALKKGYFQYLNNFSYVGGLKGT